MGGVARVRWGGGEEGQEGEEEEEGERGVGLGQEKEGGTFRVPGELLFHTREEAEAHLREALGGGRRGGRG